MSAIPGRNDGPTLLGIGIVLMVFVGGGLVVAGLWVTLTSPPYATPAHSSPTPVERIEGADA